MRALLESLAGSLVGCGAGGSTAPVAAPRPAVLIVAAPPEVLTETTAVFEFGSDREDVHYNVTLDGKSLGRQSAHLVLDDLVDGKHRLCVWATADDGATSVSSVQHDWRVDTAPPVIAVRFPPPNSFTDTGSVAVCGSVLEEGGVRSLLVNGVPADYNPTLGTWRAVVSVQVETVLRVEVTDFADNIVIDETHRITPVDPPKPPSANVIGDEFELAVVAGADEATVIESERIMAIDIESGARRVISDESTGDGDAFKDVVVMAAIPGGEAIVVFDTYQCRITTVDLDSGDRTIIWERLGPSDIPVNHEGLIASDGTYVYVQGPRKADLVALKLDGTERRTIADRGWVSEAVALTWDPDQERLLATDGKTGNVYAVDPVDGAQTVVSAHDPDFPLGYARGLALDGDRAFAIARDGNGVVAIDLDTGDREFLALAGDGLIDPRAIAIDVDKQELLVLDHGRTGLMAIDLEAGTCRERISSHVPRPECVGPIYCDQKTGELCLLDGGRCALVAIDCATGDQETIADLSGDAPDAIDFHINPVTGKAVVLERHGIYDFAPAHGSCVNDAGTTGCRLVPADPAAPLGGGLALRVEEGGGTAIILDSRPHTIDWDWIRSTVRKDSVVRVDLETGKCTLVADRAATGFGESASATGALFFDEPRGELYLGSVECGPYGSCYRGTLKLLDIDTEVVETVYGVDRIEGDTTYFKGGTMHPPAEFGVVVRDPVRNRIYTFDRENKVIGRINFEGANPRYEVFSGDLPHYDGERWTTLPFGIGSSLERARGMALDANAGILFVTTPDRVLAVDVTTGDRVVAAVLR